MHDGMNYKSHYRKMILFQVRQLNATNAVIRQPVMMTQTLEVLMCKKSLP